MKLKSLLTGALGAIAILCASCSSHPPQTDSQTQQEIRISGSGEAYRVLKALASAYEAKQPNTRVIFNPANQTSGGVSGVKDGVIDIGATSRELTPAERSGIEYRAIANDALLIATHPSVEGVTNLQTDELKAIYSGKIKNWQALGGPDATIIVIDLPEDEAEKIILREHYLGRELEVTPDAAILPTEKGIVGTVENTPHTIGPMSLVTTIAERLPVNSLSLDGIEPTFANLRNGNYKMVQTIGIVWQQEPTPTSRNFITFVLSKPGAEIIEAAGYAAIAKPND